MSGLLTTFPSWLAHAEPDDVWPFTRVYPGPEPLEFFFSLGRDEVDENADCVFYTRSEYLGALQVGIEYQAAKAEHDATIAKLMKKPRPHAGRRGNIDRK